MKNKNKIITYIPNALTTIRLLVVPLFGYFLYIRNYKIAAVIFIFACFTDILDGKIARKYNVISAYGKMIDPVADKAIQITAFGILFIQGKIPLVLLIVYAVKEISMLLGGWFLLKKCNYVSYSIAAGKIAAVILNLSLGLIIIFGFGKTVTAIIIGISIIFTLFAFYQYVVNFIKVCKNKINS